jgi:hypothetical protein
MLILSFSEDGGDVDAIEVMCAFSKELADNSGESSGCGGTWKITCAQIFNLHKQIM